MPLTVREAVRMIMEKGGRKVRPGAEHDVYYVNGQFVQVPRHRGDLSPGAERQIRKALTG